MLVPAFAFAMSRFDHDIGHHRRYTKETLGAAYRNAGIELEQLAYVNAPGLLAWLVAMKWFKGEPRRRRGPPRLGQLRRPRRAPPWRRPRSRRRSAESLLAVGRTSTEVLVATFATDAWTNPVCRCTCIRAGGLNPASAPRTRRPAHSVPIVAPSDTACCRRDVADPEVFGDEVIYLDAR